MGTYCDAFFRPLYAALAPVVITCTDTVPVGRSPSAPTLNSHCALTAVLMPCLPLLTVPPNDCWISDFLSTLHGFLVAAPAGAARVANMAGTATTRANSARETVVFTAATLPAHAREPDPRGARLRTAHPPGGEAFSLIGR